MFDDLWAGTMPAFGGDGQLWERGRRLALSSMVGLGRRTVTGMLVTCGHHDRDWSADFRLFERERFDGSRLFAPAIKASVERLVDLGQPVVAAIDDTIVRKRGRKVHGAAWRRDPLGPKFQTNLVYGQRFLQASLLWPEQAGPSRARAIPVAFEHCPTLGKPPKNASADERKHHQVACAERRLPRRAAQMTAELRGEIDRHAPGRTLIVSVDGGYTNRTLFATAPDNTVFVGRLRKDARLFAAPPGRCDPGRGRPRRYGEALPTPEDLRGDQAVPWTPVEAFAAGRLHSFSVKRISPVRWQPAGDRSLQLVIIKPLAYRLSAGSHLLYRDPAYLICSDPTLDLQTLVQAYVWRWEIETNFRDEKTLLGVGHAQVRTPAAAASLPAFIVAAYATHLAAVELSEASQLHQQISRPKWNLRRPSQRITTRDVQSLVRQELWSIGMASNFDHFALERPHTTNGSKFRNSFAPAVLFASQ